jgi:hypothetical protein
LKASTHSLDDSTALTRREFTAEAVLALLMGCVITVSQACGDDNPTNPSPTPTDISGVISANHGHIANVTSAQITTGNEVSLDIHGQADHPHTVVVSAADFQTLRSRQPVSKTSTTDFFHSHTVTFTPM